MDCVECYVLSLSYICIWVFESSGMMKWEHDKHNTCPSEVEPFVVDMLVVKSTTKSYCCSQLAEDVGKELEFFEVHKNVNKHNLAAVSHLIQSAHK